MLNLTFDNQLRADAALDALRALEAVGQRSGGWQHHRDRLRCLLLELRKVEIAFNEDVKEAAEQALLDAEAEGTA